MTGVHLVGSIPLADSEQVFREVTATVGPYLRRIPDGETGERLKWIRWVLPRLDEHPDLERLDGVMPYPVYAPRDGVTELDLGALGYADEAIASYEVFSRLKRAGVLRPDLRFQVGFPTAFGLSATFAPDAAAVALPALQRALAAEVAAVTAAIPHDELAVQWEFCMEFMVLEGLAPVPLGLDELVGLAAQNAATVPADVPVGFHLCYGDYEHAHFVEPADTGWLARVANALRAALDRDVAWFHLPVPRERDDDAYFAPLDELDLDPATEVYLGLVHATDGIDGSALRAATARRHLREFGIATECGMGRRDPETIPDLLRVHAALCEDGLDARRQQA